MGEMGGTDDLPYILACTITTQVSSRAWTVKARSLGCTDTETESGSLRCACVSRR